MKATTVFAADELTMSRSVDQRSPGERTKFGLITTAAALLAFHPYVCANVSQKLSGAGLAVCRLQFALSPLGGRMLRAQHLREAIE